MNFRRIEHGLVDSTSERAFAALAAGTAQDGDVHRARAQSAGRGRLGRSWYSPPGEGLYASVVLLPPPPPWPPALLTMAAGLAMLEAAEAGLAPGTLRLDWPNDVVDGSGAKLAGVIAETRGLDPARPHYVLGIGANVAQRAFPAELERERAVTSLALQGGETDVERVLERVLAALARRLPQVTGDAERLCADYLAATGLADAAVVVSVGDREHVGDLVGLSVEEGLVLRTPDNSEVRVPLELARSLGPA